MLQDADALPQLIGDYKPIDQWQAHINEIFYRLRGHQLRNFYQTFASADYRLAHALASDYYERVCARQARGTRHEASGTGEDPTARLSPLASRPSLIIHEWGPGNGNLAACFLTHLKNLDKGGQVYPRVRYVMVDSHQNALEAAKNHPDLTSHLNQVDTLCADAQHLSPVSDGAVDRIICNELWNDLPTKLMLRKDGDIEEEHIRPNLSETKHALMTNWSGFVRAFDAKDTSALEAFPPFFEDLIWEKEYHKVDWKDVPFRKTITEFLKRIDEEVLVPVNLGAFATIKEAKRILAPDAIGLSSFDAGTADLAVLNDPEKPCYGLFGGQHSFMVNFALAETVATHLEMRQVDIEPQREFVGRSLNANVLTLMDVLASHPSAGKKMEAYQQDRLVLKTISALNESYHAPYARKLDFPLQAEIPIEERETLQAILGSLKEGGVPDTIAYVTEEELDRAMSELETLGYDKEGIRIAFAAPPSPIEYSHFFCRPS
ncbi:MAG: class I SAM-dependent methyltransferase [Nitrospiraceae bacterium]